MTHAHSLHTPRIVTDRYSRRNILRTGGATLALSAAATLPRRAGAAQTGAATPTSGTGAQLDANAFDEFISDTIESLGVPGASVAVIQSGAPVLIKGYGIRELGSDALVDADTVFQLASNTKPMTSFVLGTLVEEGLIDWDTPITEILPELQLWDTYPTRYLTSRDVFAHRSGFPAFGGDLLGQVGYDRAEMLRRLRYVPPAGSFRSVAAYSNLGYFIAGEVIARLTGAPWEDAMRVRLMTPLGMSRSGPALADRPADGNMSANHGLVDGKLQTVPADDHGVYGSAGSAISTAHDMALWMQMLLDSGEGNGRQLMEQDTVNEMFVPSMVSGTSFSEMAPIDAYSGFSYSSGWANYHYHGYEIIEKGGALDGVRTVVCLVPQLNTGIAVMANLNLTVLPEAVRGFWLEQLLGKADTDVQQDIREAGAMFEALFADMPEPPANSVSPSVPLESFAGVYQNDLYSGFRVIVEGDVMRLEAGSAKRPASFRHFSHNTFLLDWGKVTSIPGQATFIVGPDGLAVGYDDESLGRFDRVVSE